MELAFAGAFAAAAWQVLGKLQRHTARVENAAEDRDVFTVFDTHVKNEHAKGNRETPSFGAGAHESGHQTLLEDWPKLKPAQRAALLLDLAEVVHWTEQARGKQGIMSRPAPPARGAAAAATWKGLSADNKLELLTTVDRASFNIHDIALKQAEALGENWLWQLTEGLPALAAEPAVIAGPEASLTELRGAAEAADASVSRVFLAQREQAAEGLRSASAPLEVAAAMRNVQLLRSKLESAGLNAAAAQQARTTLRSSLTGLTLEPADSAVAQSRADAQAALDADVDAVVSAERAERSAEIASAAEAMRRRALLTLAGSPSHWHASSATALRHRAALLDLLLQDVVSASEAAAGSSEAKWREELADAVRKLLPQLRLAGSSPAYDDVAAARIAELAAVLTPAPVVAAAKEEPAAAVSAAQAENGSENAADEGAEAQADGEAERAEEEVVVKQQLSVADAAKQLAATLSQLVAAAVSEAKAKASEQAAARRAAAEAAAAEAAERPVVVQVGADGTLKVVVRCPETILAVASETAVHPEDAVDIAAVQADVRASAQRRADEEAAVATAALETKLTALRAATNAKGLSARAASITAADNATSSSSSTFMDQNEDGGVSAGVRLLVAQARLTDALAPGTNTDLALPSAVSSALDFLGKDGSTLAALLAPASAEAVASARKHIALVKLVGEVSVLELGPGTAGALRRAVAWLEARLLEAERRAAAAAAAAAEAEAAAAVAAAEAEPSAADAEDTAEEAAEAKPAAAAADAAPAVVELIDTEPVKAALSAVQAALGDALVLLGLEVAQYRKLQALREAVAALAPAGDSGTYARCVSSLQDLQPQLGPIGAAVDARLASTTDASTLGSETTSNVRDLLQGVRIAAVGLYTKLGDFLDLETKQWAGAKEALSKAKQAVFGIKVERKPSTLVEGGTAAKATGQQAAVLAAALRRLGSSEAAAALPLVQALQDAAAALVKDLKHYLQYARLREHALGQPSSAPAEQGDGDAADDEAYADDDEEGFELVLPDLTACMQSHDDVEWVDTAGFGDALMPLPEDEEELAAEAEAQGTTVEDLRATHGAAIEEFTKRVEGWRTTGLRAIARGQAASVLIAGGIADVPSSSSEAADGQQQQQAQQQGQQELRCAADIGLPSAKCLLALWAERLARLQMLAAEGQGGLRAALPWYIVVTPSSASAVQSLLEDNKYFGLTPGQVRVVVSDVAPPLLSETGKVVLEPSAAGPRVARGPPGTGDVLLALRRSGALAEMDRLGIRVLDVQALEDNVLGLPADPTFLGVLLENGLDVASKVAVPGLSTEGSEVIGDLYSRYLGLLGVKAPLLESHLAGLVPSLGAYAMTVGFAKRLDAALRRSPLALVRLAPAEKVYAKTGAKPGYRLDRRLSDLASPAVRTLVPDAAVGCVVVDPGQEWALAYGSAPFFRPASTKPAVDLALLRYTSWVLSAGGAVADEESGVVEVGPLASYCGEGLEGLVKDKLFEEAYVPDLQGCATAPSQRSNMGVWAIPAALLYVGVGAAKVLKASR